MTDRLRIQCESGDASLFPGRDSEDGWTPLEFYAWIIRNLGIPKQFRLRDNGEWVAEGPFTKPAASLLIRLEALGV